MKLNGVRFFALLALVVVCVAGCPKLVFITDDGLEKAIREEIGRPLGFLTEDDLAQVLELDARGYSIRDLTGIEYCKNLAWIDLSTNQISNLRPLEQLGHPENPYDSPLVYLNLDSNLVTDITPLSGLLNLKQLSLFNNQVTDIAALLTNMQAGGTLDSVNLSTASLSDQAINNDIPYLESLGVVVTQSGS